MQKTLILLTDDLDATGETPADRKVSFALNGTDYEIDLSEANAKGFEDMLVPYIAVARVVTRKAPSPRRSPGQRDRSSTAREWLIANGHLQSRRGRIPAEKLAIWRAAGSPGLTGQA